MHEGAARKEPTTGDKPTLKRVVRKRGQDTRTDDCAAGSGCQDEGRVEPAARFDDDFPLPFQPMGSAATGAIPTQARHVRAGAPKWYDTSLCGAAAACGRIFAR